MNRFPLIFGPILRNVEGGASGAAPNPGAGGGAPNPGAGGGAPGSSPGAAPAGGGIAPPPPAQQWSMPDGFPDRLRADSEADFYRKLSDDWRAQRDQIAKFPAAPKDAGEYKVALSEKTSKIVGDLEKDPTFALAKNAALAAGIPADAFGKLVPAFYDALAEKGLLSSPIDVKSEAAKFLGRNEAFADERAAAEALLPIFEPIQRAVDKFADDNKLAPEAKAAIYALMDTAEGMKVAQLLFRTAESPGLKPGGATGGVGSVTQAQLDERVRDPRNKFGGVDYDQNFASETRRMFKEFTGGA